MHPHSKEGQRPPGLHWKEHCQHIEGGDPSILQCTDETAGELGVVLGSPVQDKVLLE